MGVLVRPCRISPMAQPNFVNLHYGAIEMKIPLTQRYVDHELRVPFGLSRFEAVDAALPGHYILVSATGAATYFLRYKDSTGKTCHQKIGRTTDISLADSRKKAKALKAEIALGADPQAEAKAQKEVLTFSEFFENHYLPHAKRHKRSWRRDEQLYRLRLKDAFGRKVLNRITRHEIVVFHSALPDQGLAPASCDHHLKLLKHALNLAIDWEFLAEKNPASRIPLFNVPNLVQHQLSDSELARLIQVLKTDKNKTVCQIVLLLLASGARVAEALKSKWSHIDRMNRQWYVPMENSKSKKPRVIQLTDAAIDVLNELPTEGKHEWLFINQSTKKPLTTIMRVWTRLRNKAGLPHLRLHDCRHLYITWVLEGGASLFHAAQLAGHSNPVLTSQRYAHLSKSVLQGAANNASVKLKGAMKEAA
jgi:integrase